MSLGAALSGGSWEVSSPISVDTGDRYLPMMEFLLLLDVSESIACILLLIFKPSCFIDFISLHYDLDPVSFSLHCNLSTSP